MHAMKKTMLAAAAALGATAACAADVTVYGLVDYGLMYTGTDNNQTVKLERDTNERYIIKITVSRG